MLAPGFATAFLFIMKKDLDREARVRQASSFSTQYVAAGAELALIVIAPAKTVSFCLSSATASPKPDALSFSEESSSSEVIDTLVASVEYPDS